MTGQLPASQGLRVFSYGGGQQSTAALVLTARGVIDFPDFVFCNVGDGSEHPRTLEYVRDVAMPYAAAHEIRMHVLHPRHEDGRVRDMYEDLLAWDGSYVPFPAYVEGGAQGRRLCTAQYKIAVTADWLRERGASAEEPARLGLGISTDEFWRAKTKRDSAWQVHVYPLLELRLDRTACQRITQEAGLPDPGKSACFYCPYRPLSGWRKMRAEEPEVFERAARLEEGMSAKRAESGKGKVFLCSRRVPLRDAIELASVEGDEEEDTCESGYCMV